MRILHVIHSVDPRSGGPSNALRGMVRAQVDRGDRVEVLATSIQSAEPWDDAAQYRRRMCGEESFAAVDLCILPTFGRKRPWSRWGYSPTCVRELRSRLADSSRRPDIVHVHGIFSHLTSAAAQLAARAGVPYVIRPAGGLDPWCLGARHAAGKGLLLRLLLEPQLRRAAFLHAMSPAEAEVLSRWQPPGGVKCLSHGVEVPQRLDAARDAFHSAFPQTRGRRCILFLGRLHAKKRPELLVNALAGIRSEFPEALLVFAGHDDGHEAAVRAAATMRQLDDAVLFTGFLTGIMKSGAFAAAEIFALPSRDENFGVSVIEAMAHGAAPLVTHGVGAHVHVDKSGCGLTVEDDVEAIRQGLASLLRSDPRSLGRLGIEYVEAHLSWSGIARQLDELYLGAIESQGRRPMVAA